MNVKLGGIDHGYLRLLAKLQSPLLLVLRLYCGWQFFLTGKGKLTHLDKTGGFFATLHIPMPKLNGEGFPSGRVRLRAPGRFRFDLPGMKVPRLTENFTPPTSSLDQRLYVGCEIGK